MSTVTMTDYDFKVRISPDSCPSDPRDFDNIGILTGTDTVADKGYRYRTSSDTLRHIVEDCGGTVDDDADDDKLLEQAESLAVVLPVYCYKHGGIAYSTDPFSCRWDSGQVGYTYVSLVRVREEFGDTSDATLEKVRTILRAELETFSQWANGDVYGFEIVDPTGEEVDNLWGFYGTDHEASGLLDAAREQLPKDAKIVVVEE